MTPPTDPTPTTPSVWRTVPGTLLVLALAFLIGGFYPGILFGVLFLGSVIGQSTHAHRHHPDSANARILIKRLQGVMIGVVLFAAFQFSAYVGARSYTKNVCSAASTAPTLEARQAGVEEMDKLSWLKWTTDRFTNKGIFVFDCDGLKGQLLRLKTSGHCPGTLIEGVPCTCSGDPWDGKMCQDGSAPSCGYTDANDRMHEMIFCK